jgi:hypothetical protein
MLARTFVLLSKSKQADDPAGDANRFEINSKQGDKTMGGNVEKTNLQNGETVALASWEDLKPTEHGTGRYNTAWSQHKDREGLAFYESTVQYMRNDWAAQHMPSHLVSDGKGQNALLYYHGTTKTWHTADALDIDHAVQWKDHLKAKNVTNMGDAQMAYNDVDNLRMLPSTYNRARDSADKILTNHGAQSTQWKEWVDSRFTFDATVQYREFDPEKDGARRMKTTKDQSWTEENTRSELSFDKRVLEVWFNKELEKNYVGSPPLTNPDGSGTTNVPLFRCAATGQLVTRDALDVDHAIPLEQVLKKMHEMFPQGFSKADALDAYNDTSNLRLVGRSANSSHEWELMPDGHFRDSKVTEIPGEFKKFIVEDGELPSSAKQAVHQVMGEMREHQRQRMQEYFAQQSSPQQTPSQLTSSQASQNAPLVNQSGHRYNPVFKTVEGEIAKLDPQGKVFTDQDQRDRMASALMVMAKHHGLPSIDSLAWSKDGQSVFAFSGNPSDGKFVWLSNQEGKSQTVERNTQSLAMIQNTPSLATQTQAVQQGQSNTHPHLH